MSDPEDAKVESPKPRRPRKPHPKPAPKQPACQHEPSVTCAYCTKVPDADGMFHGERTTMRTYSGRRIEPMDVKVFDIEIVDVAHALSRQCRFNGHCAGFLSVAGHSIRVHDELVNTPHAPWGLMHDAAETYLGDIIRPMKYSGKFDAYFEAEERAERALAERYRLEWPMPAAVKAADSKVAVFELEHLWHAWDQPDVTEKLFIERFRRYWP